MPYHYGNYRNITDNEWLECDCIELNLGHTGILCISKSIRKLADKHGLRHFICIHLHRLTAEKIIGVHIFEPCHMVLMRMSKYYCIKMFNIFAEHLGTKIRPGIYNIGGGG